MADPLRHVRFEGRPPAKTSRLAERRQSSPAAVAHAHEPRSSERPGPFLSWVLERAGLSAHNYRGEPLQRRLPALLRALHAHTEEQARLALEEQPDLLPVAIGSLLIGVTEFFRDAPVFEALRTEIVPKLGHPGRRPLRVWSAGCSTGAEVFSVAMLLEEAGLLARSYLLGSDFRSDAIAHAQAALYNQNDIRRIDPPDIGKYFDCVGNHWRPVQPLRRHAHWKVADLGRNIEDGPWDMILWRNMAIYLQPRAAMSVWQSLVSALAPGGVLVVGRAERPPEGLPLVQLRRCIYRSISRDNGHASGHRPANPRHPKIVETSR